MFNENFYFWEITFGDLIPIITTILSPILIYYIYKMLDNYRDKKLIRTAFLRFKRHLKSKLPENKEKLLFDSQMSFFKALGNSKPETLIKIGIEVPIFSHTKGEYAVLHIVDKYLLTIKRFENSITHEPIENNKDVFKEILEEMRIHAKNYYGLKFKKKIIKFN